MLPATSSPRLLVVAVDRLPAWILPAYGTTWLAMPTVTAWAARGVVFDRLLATGTDPRRTLTDLVGPVAARLPTAVVTDDAALPADACGAVAAVRRVPLRPRADVADDVDDTSFGRLCAAAAETISATDRGLVVLHATGLAHAWDAPREWCEAYRAPGDPPLPAGAVVPDMIATADTDPDLLVGLRHVFAGQVSLLDRCLALLGDLAGWTVLFCGLRGMGLGLHGRIGPGGMPPFGELMHLPAILVDVAGRMAGQRFGGLAIPADLGATLAMLADGPAAEPDGGQSLAGLFSGWQAEGRDRVVAATSEGAAVTTAGWHAVAAADGTLRLYAKPDDFFEVTDVADRCPAVAAELGRLVAAARAGDTATAWTAPLSTAADRGIA